MSVVTSTSSPQQRPRLIRAGLLLVLAGLAIGTVYMLSARQPPAYRVQVIQTPGGWGYDILSNNTLFIHQPTIPGQSGLTGFSSQEQARRVGERVVEKIKQTQAMPALSNDELRQLGVTIP